MTKPNALKNQKLVPIKFSRKTLGSPSRGHLQGANFYPEQYHVSLRPAFTAASTPISALSLRELSVLPTRTTVRRRKGEVLDQISKRGIDTSLLDEDEGINAWHEKREKEPEERKKAEVPQALGRELRK